MPGRKFAVGVLLLLVLTSVFGARTSEAIYNGELDTTNQAVVAWLHNSKCSAVVIARQGFTGWAITAAHCAALPLGSLYQGNDHNNPDRTYSVVEQFVHPEFATNPAYNFALLQFSGADASTPVMAPLAPFEDPVGVGTSLTFSGYGNTESGSTSRRYMGVVEALTVSPIEIYSESTVNAGSGDSGGAVIVQIGGEPRLAGTMSYIVGDPGNPTGTGCARVSAVYIDFLVEVIGLPYPPFFADGFESGDTTGWTVSVP